MITPTLPPLPEPFHGFYATPMYSPDQMRAYALEAIAAAHPQPAPAPADSLKLIGWIGLTDRERDRCWRQLGDGDGFPEYAEAIELLLQEKNAAAQPAPLTDAQINQITAEQWGPDIAAKLRDPVAVHAAMLRGEIATPAIRDMLHVYGADALARWDAAPSVPSEPVAWIDADGDVYKTEPAGNWCPPHHPLYTAPQPAAGWRLVPAEPTEAMQAVIRNEYCVYGSEWALYAAMLDAAPAAPDAQGAA
jgi:hypothetical protein